MTTVASSRWLPAAFAAALLAGTLTIIAVNVGDAAGNSPSSLVPIVPCRLADTRADQQVGSRGQPIPANTSVTFAVWGTNGECTIPSTATGIATNVTIVNPSAGSFLTVYPSDAATRPKASNLNWLPGSPPTPNQVTVALSADGAINVYNLAGTVDVIIDIVGYYVQAQIAAPTTTAPPTTTTTTTTTTTVPPLPTVIQGTEGSNTFHAACGGCANYPVTVSVPAGRWLVNYTVVNVNFTGTSDLFRCWVESSDGLSGPIALTTSRVGPNTDVSPHSGQATITLSSTKNVRIACAHDNNIAGGVGLLANAYMEGGLLTFLKVAP
jgi:hypothetical protein